MSGWLRLIVVFLQIVKQWARKTNDERLIQAGKVLQREESRDATEEMVERVKEGQDALSPSDIDGLLRRPENRLGRGQLAGGPLPNADSNLPHRGENVD